MKVGFSGTRRGMTERQKFLLKKFLLSVKPSEFHHGDCIGADAEAHGIADELDILIIIHPPEDDKLRAYCPAFKILPPKAYLKRNLSIANSTDVLIAAPFQIPFEEFEELVCPTPEDASQIEKLIQELLEEGENNV